MPVSIVVDVPVELWNIISYLDIHVYHTLALVIKGLERDIDRRKHHFAVWTYYDDHSTLTLNGRPYCDERPAWIHHSAYRDHHIKIWLSANNEIHRVGAPAIVYDGVEEFYTFGVLTSVVGKRIMLSDVKESINPNISVKKFLAETGLTIYDLAYDMPNRDIRLRTIAVRFGIDLIGFSREILNNSDMSSQHVYDIALAAFQRLAHMKFADTI